MSATDVNAAERIRQTVRSGYADIATRGKTGEGGGC